MSEEGVDLGKLPAKKTANGEASLATKDDRTDPLLELPSKVVRDGDYVILMFADGKQIFAQCLSKWKGKFPPLKINRKSYSTADLVGLPYGTVLELDRNGLTVLPEGEDVLPDFPPGFDTGSPPDDTETTMPKAEQQPNDNRHLLDDNKSQSMKQQELLKLREEIHGSEIVQALIENSSTFDSKTDFSKAKYIARKMKKYQQRCRMVRCTGATICEALFYKDPRKLMNMREDTLGQILSYSNVTAGCQVLVMETCLGIVTGALAQRMGGYGKILSLYSGQQHSFLDMLSRFNLSFAEFNSIKWVHSGDVFADDAMTVDTSQIHDQERIDREKMEWPCPLQDHTRTYLKREVTDEKELDEFMTKRCNRFARKLTRHTPTEGQEMLLSRPCDSIVIASRYDPTPTLLGMLPFLAPSCPFVVFCEFLEPLTECFHELQRQGLAINLKLSDTWMREYQVLPDRTHPAMNMSQNGGFLLVGTKLCPVTGHNELEEGLLKELRTKVGGRRGRRAKRRETFKRQQNGGDGTKSNEDDARESKRARVDGEP